MAENIYERGQPGAGGSFVAFVPAVLDPFAYIARQVKESEFVRLFGDAVMGLGSGLDRRGLSR